MAKDEKKEASADGPFEVAGVKKGGMFHVVLRTRAKGRVEERVLKSSPDWRIAADRLAEGMDIVRKGGK